MTTTPTPDETARKTAQKTALILTVTAAAATFAFCGGSPAREILFGVVLAAVAGLAVAVVPIVALALLVRRLRGSLDAHPEVHLAPRGQLEGDRLPALERHPAVT